MSIKQVLFDKDFRVSTHVCFMLMFFMMWSGIDAVNIYSNRILSKLDPKYISPNSATTLIGFMLIVGSIFALLIINRFGRVKILLFAHIAFGVIHLLLALCIIFNKYLATVILLNLYVFLFAVTDGAIMWIYSAEVL